MTRHPLDVLSLVFGILFVAIATIGLVDALTLSLGDLRWLLPALLIVIGGVLLVTGGTRAVRAEVTEDGDAR
ncbi:MAG: hypothetical protein WDZ26_02915 [Nitriliruptoraceae bacterium]